MIRSPFAPSAASVAALLALIFVFDAGTSQAVPATNSTANTPLAVNNDNSSNDTSDEAAKKAAAETNTEEAAEKPQTFQATAYSLRGRTASGQFVRRGIIAADRRVLPLGTRVRLSAGSQSGVYTVADTGGAVRGRKIDIWVPSTSEAMRFGRRNIQLTVLQYPRGSRAATRSGTTTTRPRTVKK